MTLEQLYEISLRTIGLGTSSSTFQTNVLRLMQMSSDMLLGISPWYFRRKKGTITTSSGDNQYDFASDFEYPISAKNYTKNWTLHFKSLDWLEEADPDESRSGSPTHIIPMGINETNSVFETLVYPKPDATETLRYWYISQVPDLTALSSSTDMDKYMPKWAQNYIVFDAAGLYLAEKGISNKSLSNFSIRDQFRDQGLRIHRMFVSDKDMKLGRGHINADAGKYFHWSPEDGALTT